MSDDSQLRLRVRCSFAGAVGYGPAFRCQVLEVLSGSLDQESIVVTILAGDRAKEAIFSARAPEDELEIGFRRRAGGEPYPMAPIFSPLMSQTSIPGTIRPANSTSRTFCIDIPPGLSAGSPALVARPACTTRAGLWTDGSGGRANATW